MNNSYYEKKEEEEVLDKVFSLISKILENYGLEEDEEKIIDKIVNGEPTHETIIIDAISKIQDKKIPEERLISFLSKGLNISEIKGKKILKDIKEKIIPTLEIDIERQETTPGKISKVHKKDIYREPIE